MVDTEELFRRLSAGASFNKQRVSKEFSVLVCLKPCHSYFYLCHRVMSCDLRSVGLPSSTRGELWIFSETPRSNRRSLVVRSQERR